MNARVLSVLVVVNAMLLAALTLVWHDTSTPAPAEAQFGSGSNFTMVSGTPRSGDRDVVYVIELNSGKLAAFTFSAASRKFNQIDVRSLQDDLQRAGGGGGR
ncbi:MAG: hypothetical protein AAF750_00020 [Planctomycetota bacterium]